MTDAVTVGAIITYGPYSFDGRIAAARRIATTKLHNVDKLHGGTAVVMTLREASQGGGDDGHVLTSMEEALAAIARAVEMRDPYSAGHQRKVSDLAVAIARKMGLDAERVRGLRLAAVLLPARF